MEFNRDILKIDCAKEIEKITEFVNRNLLKNNRKGVVVGLSGGIDSALIASICVEALGRENVLGVILPEKESSPLSAKYAQKEANRLDIRTTKLDITSILQAIGTYQKRDTIVKDIFPEYNSKCKLKITLPGNLLEVNRINIFTLKMINESNEAKVARLNKNQLNGIIAASNTKQRVRMLCLYYYAEYNHYLVCGTTNKTETLQGFFVKHGDGGVDLEPLAHLYKDQVYQLAHYLGVSNEIIERQPTPDTYSAEVSDEEFYFRIPYQKLDLLLYGWVNNIPKNQICEAMQLAPEQVDRVFKDFQNKYNTTQHMRELPPTLKENTKYYSFEKLV